MHEITDHETRAQGMIQSFNVHGISLAPGFPYKHVTSTDMGDCFFITISGMLGTNEYGKLVDASAHAQIQQAIKNIQLAILAAIEHLDTPASHDDALGYIVQSRADLDDLAHVPDLNKAYIEMQMPFTARTAVEVKKLPLGAMVEITVIAVLPK